VFQCAFHTHTIAPVERKTRPKLGFYASGERVIQKATLVFTLSPARAAELTPFVRRAIARRGAAPLQVQSRWVVCCRLNRWLRGSRENRRWFVEGPGRPPLWDVNARRWGEPDALLHVVHVATLPFGMVCRGAEEFRHAVYPFCVGAEGAA
jgi:hypothetical protein